VRHSIWSRPMCAVVLATVISAFAHAAELSGRIRMPGPSVQDLMLGTWTIQVTHEPSARIPKGRVNGGREVWRPGPGERSLIEEYDEDDPSKAIHELGIAWWDASEKGQKVLWCGDYQPSGCDLVPGVARWEGNSLVQTVEAEESGKHVVRQEIFTDITRASFTQILKEGPTRAGLKVTTTIRATRSPVGSGVVR
jgi:hypothetical protein